MTPFAERLSRVRGEIAEACHAASREPSEVKLVAVSKSVGAAEIADAHRAGLRAFGESYVQKALVKQEQLAGLAGVEWHLVGRLQSNKAAKAAAAFGWIQSVDSLKLARLLSRARAQRSHRLDVLVEVRLGGGGARAGVAPEAAEELAAAVAELPGLALRGLMAVAPLGEPARPAFARLRTLFETLRARSSAGPAFDELSCGMSEDYVDAIMEGSTMVRIGRALFGA